MGIMEKKMETTYNGLGYRIYGVYGDLIIIDPKPYSIYFKGDYKPLRSLHIP